mmetsp:Transcript_27376/g.56647  ORF Transcript_27376/g.56647 Transcript_27376/m.56647 type:complete len:250 (+) Transcript_27376:2981-3730(+)
MTVNISISLSSPIIEETTFANTLTGKRTFNGNLRRGRPGGRSDSMPEESRWVGCFQGIIIHGTIVLITGPTPSIIPSRIQFHGRILRRERTPSHDEGVAIAGLEIAVRSRSLPASSTGKTLRGTPPPRTGTSLKSGDAFDGGRRTGSSRSRSSARGSRSRRTRTWTTTGSHRASWSRTRSSIRSSPFSHSGGRRTASIRSIFRKGGSRTKGPGGIVIVNGIVKGVGRSGSGWTAMTTTKRLGYRWWRWQ